ncbi:fungal-specific transcription factor domain-containing protein [Mycena polygramma]|nr:fungal-specific transcription factor domain-containing protein [Mycena polygramma]
MAAPHRFLKRSRFSGDSGEVPDLVKLLPGIDFTQELDNEYEVEPLLHQHAERPLPRNDEHIEEGSLGKLKLNPENNRFFGKSSGIQLVQTALNFQRDLTGVELPQFKSSIVAERRQEFWTTALWLVPPPDEAPEYIWPDPDLLTTLVDLYFAQVNPFWPVLHRPTFDRKVAQRLHLSDRRFGATLLLVCSLGARYSDDPRVLLEGVEKHPSHSAGVKWYRQVTVIPKHLIYKPDLYELQTIALAAVYARGFSPTALGWIQLGVGLRRAQDVGAHRRRNQPYATAENEHWKRVFWVLLCLEWVASTHTGRPHIMHDRDFDQDLPIECDDEYWDANFKQPKDRPSELSYFICYAKLLEIQAAVTTAIYSPRKPKDFGGHSFPQTDAQSLMSFDSALNSWLNNVPEHLRWDPDRKNMLHLTQSALLHTAYYNVQILVHRPFIPTPLETSQAGPLPSLAICTNAARSCVRIFDAYIRRKISLHYSIPAAFTAGIVLLLNAWSRIKTGFANNPSKELDQIESCLRVTTAAEKRYPVAGRYSDLMLRLLYAGHSFDLLYDLSVLSTAPPSAQLGHETTIPPQSFNFDNVQPPSMVVQHRVEDFEAASDQLYATFNSRLDIPQPQYPDNRGPDMFSTADGSYKDPNQIYDFEHLMSVDTPQLPADMTAAMWSTAPATFHVDEWSYLMARDTSGPQSAPMPRQQYAPVQSLQQDEEFARIMGMSWLY